MARYIDADKMRDNAIRMGFHSTTMTISELIDLQPTADVRENVRGEWILDEDDGDCRCSHCGIAIDQMHKNKHGLLNALTNGKWWTFYSFCPNCGADMRGKV